MIDIGNWTICSDNNSPMTPIVLEGEFDKEGNIKRCPEGDTYLMFMAIGVNWSMRDNNIEMGFHIVQDEFRDDE